MNVSSKLFIPKLYCSVVGHQYRITKKVTNHIKEYTCSCCGKEVTNDAKGVLVPLTPKLKFIHLGLEQVIIKRRRTKRSKMKIVA
ncbi:hypothetical protein [Aquimarina agarivorans]|uniref:hypothetical protein n=1 Tax=Aquimarina agarivorans TaxID=980584 RepID=UPI000248ED62|nr:hypothetical protein [Aquimarina agarivorans]